MMVFENTKLSKVTHLDALPFMVDGDVVLFQPSRGDNGDKITIYGGGSITSTMTDGSQMMGRTDRPTPLKPLGNESSAIGAGENSLLLLTLNWQTCKAQNCSELWQQLTNKSMR
jgi:hypothetical protein